MGLTALEKWVNCDGRLPGAELGGGGSNCDFAKAKAGCQGVWLEGCFFLFLFLHSNDEKGL